MTGQFKGWQKRFKNGGIHVDSNSRSGGHLMIITADDIEHVRLVVEDDRQLIVREVETDLETPTTTVWVKR